MQLLLKRQAILAHIVEQAGCMPKKMRVKLLRKSSRKLRYLRQVFLK